MNNGTMTVDSLTEDIIELKKEIITLVKQKEIYPDYGLDNIMDIKIDIFKEEIKNLERMFYLLNCLKTVIKNDL